MTDEIDKISCPRVGPKYSFSKWSWQMAPGYDNECYFDYSSGKKLRYNTKMIGYLQQYMYNNNYNAEDIVVAKLGNGKPQYHGVYSNSSTIPRGETKEAREKRLAEEKEKEEYMNDETKILPAFTKDIYKFTPDKGDEKPKEEEKKLREPWDYYNTLRFREVLQEILLKKSIQLKIVG